MKNKSVKTMVASVLAVGLMMGIPASAFAVSPGGMSVPSAQSVDSSENCAQILDWLGIQIPRHFDSQAPYKINTLSESDPNYWQAEWETQVYNYKMVRNYPTLYTQDAWDAAQSAGTVMMGLHPESLTDANKQQILEARDAIAALADHQLKPYSDGINGEVIYLWGDDMPVTTLAEDLQFPLVNYEGESVYDNADFQPFLIPYLLDDPSSAKGTIIVASGGGNTSRSNPVEAYAVCPEFNKLGYNCFLLQRRVAPYNNDDIVMDMQRAVRMVKYYSDQWGIDLEGSLLAVSGYSGSGGNIRTMLKKFYGNITPSQFDPDYVCDAVDAAGRLGYLGCLHAIVRLAAAREAMLPWLHGVHGNPSGSHRLARAARRAVDDARDNHMETVRTKINRRKLLRPGCFAFYWHRLVRLFK